MQREIIYITESSGYGGAETYLLSLASAAALDFARVTVSLPFRGQNVKLRQKLQESGIHVMELKQYRANYIWNFLVALKFFLSHKSGLFHFTLSHPDSCRWILLAASLLRRKYIITELLVPPDPYRAGSYFLITHLLFNWLKRFSYARAVKVIAICEIMKNTLVQAYNLPAQKIMVIYNGIDLAEAGSRGNNMNALRQELRLSEENFLLTTAGRLTVQKGHRYLIAALERLVVEFPSIIILVMGEGPLQDTLKEEVIQKRLDDHVRFVGFREEFRSILRLTGIFVFPSLDEGFPYMIIEAMAAGNPIVASAVGGIPEAVIDGETGQLVPAKDVERLYLAIRNLLNDAGRREMMGEKGQKRVEELFTREIMLQKTFSLYRGVP